jgi:hypothetical protein
MTLIGRIDAAVAARFAPSADATARRSNRWRHLGGSSVILDKGPKLYDALGI